MGSNYRHHINAPAEIPAPLTAPQVYGEMRQCPLAVRLLVAAVVSDLIPMPHRLAAEFGYRAISQPVSSVTLRG